MRTLRVVGAKGGARSDRLVTFVIFLIWNDPELADNMIPIQELISFLIRVLIRVKKLQMRNRCEICVILVHHYFLLGSRALIIVIGLSLF